jgi:anti-sigma-K factor RskA
VSEHEWLAAAAGYALDALDPDERAAFEAHLADCATCRDEVRSLRETADLLAHAAPAAVPADALRGRVLAEARRVRPLRRRSAVVPWIVAAAAVLALALDLGRGAALRRGLEVELAAARRLVAEKDSTLLALLAPEVHVVSLAATGREPRVRVFWNHQRNVFVVTAFDLPPAPTGRTYQLWALARDRAPVSMGTFNAGSDGRAVLLLPADSTVLALGFLDGCALTEEPAGGSPGPTETPRFVGTWRHTS